ncbi:MAG TPA: tRNA pseudouridine(55) synthase TruB [Kofleriaceae bacterium]|nr:tRNA pseudouridine(55) synthase TruB [Kofleriaceae bacterium]
MVDKPGGLTSAEVVAEVKRRLRAARVGHTGTLDPMATGVLPLCLDEATKLAPWLLADDKSYDGELELGAETDTLDAEGQVTRRRPDQAAAVGREALAAALAAQVGERLQVPPMFSAIKQGGVRLHELARAGIEVERQARPVRIDRLELIDLHPPRARFRVDCSKGTYVRSLVAEIGEALGCGAHLTALRRTRAGAFTLAQAIPLAEVSPASPRLTLAEAVGHLPAVAVPDGLVAAVAAGRPLRFGQISRGEPPAGPIRLLDPGGGLLAMATAEGGQVRYLRVFSNG